MTRAGGQSNRDNRRVRELLSAWREDIDTDRYTPRLAAVFEWRREEDRSVTAAEAERMRKVCGDVTGAMLNDPDPDKLPALVRTLRRRWAWRDREGEPPEDLTDLQLFEARDDWVPPPPVPEEPEEQDEPEAPSDDGTRQGHLIDRPAPEPEPEPEPEPVNPELQPEPMPAGAADDDVRDAAADDDGEADGDGEDEPSVLQTLIDAWAEVPDGAKDELVKAIVGHLKEDDQPKTLTDEERIEEALRGMSSDEPDPDAVLRAALVREPLLKIEAAPIPWADTPSRREWVVDGLIPANRVTLFTGMGEIGKSRLLLQLAVAVIQDGIGLPMLPLDPNADNFHDRIDVPRVSTTGPVWALSWEDEAEEWHRRAWMAANAGAFDEETSGSGEGVTWQNRVPADLSRRMERDFRIADMRKARAGPLWAPKKAGGGHTNTEGEWTKAGWEVIKILRRDRPVLCIVDPLAAAFASNENDRGLVRDFLANLDGEAEEAGCAVILCAHPPKPDNKGEAAAYSGSTDWRNAVRSLLHVDTIGSGYAPAGCQDAKKAKAKEIRLKALKRDKSSYGPNRAPVWLRHHYRKPESDETLPELAWFATHPEAAAQAAIEGPVELISDIPEDSGGGSSGNKRSRGSKPKASGEVVKSQHD